MRRPEGEPFINLDTITPPRHTFSYKIGDGGIIGFYRRIPRPDYTSNEAEDIITSARNVASIQQGQEPEITFQEKHGVGTKIITDPKTSIYIAEQLDGKGYVSELEYDRLLKGKYPSTTPVSTLQEAELMASTAADKHVQQAGQSKRKKFFGLF